MKKRLIFISVVSAALLSLFGYFQQVQISQSSAPIPTRGRQFTSYRDAEGVAHISGNNIFDVVYGQGYDHAQQRLFQMDTMRRLISGRLSETVQIDKYFRTLGVDHAVTTSLDQLTDYQNKVQVNCSQFRLKAFAAGVNDYALKDMKIHPLEYWMTNSRFTQWEPRDSLLLTKLIHYSMTFDFQFQLMREQMAEAVGWDIVDQVITNRESQFNWGTQAYILNDEELKQAGLLAQESPRTSSNTKDEGTSEKSKAEAKTTKQGDKSQSPKTKRGNKVAQGSEYLNEVQGSNCWAVHGKYTESGKPMLMGDPHLGNTVPSQWIINQLNVNGNYTLGAALPGLPGVFIGKTSVAAWSMTAMGADIADIFYEKIGGNEYYYNGAWHKLKERKEIINVKGGHPVQLIVQSTGHGPLVQHTISSVAYAFLGKIEWDESKPISLQWAGVEHPIDKIDTGTLFATPDLINTGEKLVNALLNGYNGFQVSMCFATQNGDIGYIGGVKQPIKGSSAPHHISEGWDPKNDWKGYVQDQELPYIINPKKGFVSCSNQRVASDKMKFPFASNMAPMSRAVTQHTQLESYIKQGKKITVEDMKALQFNVYDSAAKETLPLMLSLLSQKQKQEYSDSIKALNSWNLNAEEDSIGASLFYVWETSILAGLFEGFEFKNGLDEKLSYFRNFMWETWFIGRLRDWAKGKDTQNLVCGGKKVVEPEGNCVKVIQDAFDRTHFILTQKLGQDKRLWQWGHLHRVHYQHALSKTPFKPFFHKSYASLGSRRNLNVAAYYVNEDYELDGRHGANLRVVVDFGGDAFWSLDMGNSAIKGSEHYEDLHAQHQRGGYVKMEPVGEKS